MSDTKPYSSFEVSPISGALGAVVTGIDLSNDLDSIQLKDIKSALNEFLVLLFRDRASPLPDSATLQSISGR